MHDVNLASVRSVSSVQGRNHDRHFRHLHHQVLSGAGVVVSINAFQAFGTSSILVRRISNYAVGLFDKNFVRLFVCFLFWLGVHLLTCQKQ